MTYKVRVMKKPHGYLVNGSVAILIPKRRIKLNKEDLIFFSSSEYREFMQIARNYQTRTLNIDSTSVYFFGIRR
jgi:DNA (cytosine-5)-methyltransferase 1